LKSAAAAVGETSRASIDSKVSDAALDPPRLSKDALSLADSSNAELPPTPSTGPVPSDIVSPTVAEQPSAISIPEIMVAPKRLSLESPSSRPSVELSLPGTTENDTSAPRSPSEIEAELSSLRQTHEQTVSEHREEINTHLERIDALQSKLTYLTQQLAAQTKAASSSPDSTALEKKVAEKDAQIAALLEEGQNLSKTELKHLSAIKKMRAKATETDKEINTLKQRLSKAEKNITETAERARRAEAAEKAAQEQLKIVGKIEKEIAIVKQEREEASLTITELRNQLSDAISRADDAEKRAQAGALEAEKRVTASLQEDLENLRIEKKLAEDRAKREIQQAKEEATRNQEKTKMVELELKGEITVFHPRLGLFTLELT
jgi:TATA element modulatory factor